MKDNQIRPIDQADAFPDDDRNKFIFLSAIGIQVSDLEIGTGVSMASDVKKWGSSKRTTALRFLELLENLSGSFGDEKYLINYPLTNSNSLARKTKPEIMNIGTLSLRQRRELESIAWNVGIVRPDGEFNCQNWIAAVLSVATARDLISAVTVHAIVKEALEHDATADVLTYFLQYASIDH